MRPKVLKFQHVTAALLLSAAPAAAQPASTPAPDAQIGARMDEHMRGLVPFGFNGALLVVKDGQTLVRGGYGTADLESGRAFTAETPFYIGSLTKQFTAAGILRLEMEGRLRVTDSIGRFIPGVPADKRGITLHHLLTHTAGLASDPPAGVDAERSREAVIREILAAPLQRPTGSGYAYSNAGYVLLAVIVQAAAGVPFEQYLRERLWTPAGMRHTGYRPAGMENVAVGYTGGTRWGTPMERHPSADGPTWSLRGAGGMISTLDDMQAWMRALESRSVLSDEALGKLWAPQVQQGAQSHYGYGWVITRTSRNTGLVWHNGSNGVYYAELRRYPDEGVLMIIASNVAEASAESALSGVVRLTFGLPYTPPPVASRAQPEQLRAAAGSYRLPTGGTLTAAAANGGLSLTAEGPDAYAALRGSSLPPHAQQAGAQSVAVLQAAVGGDYAPLHQALGGEVPVEEVGRMFRANMETQGLGAVRAAELVGTVAGEASATALVRMRMERGETMVRLVWREGRVVELDGASAPGPAVFLPTPDGSWITYDLQSNVAVRMRLTGDGMEFDTPAGPVRAVRGR
jgi:CubicO group peptidase (beta-lactamase class C family)